ncbi:MAG TPA: lysine 5,6-aminomutase subunit alpha [Bacillota bacterium]|jgi:beta-lysine 5,6-aminomutase alpha subunit|nr:lysine 5,6-aminomutase subunit alpha [Bacillota bacterium]HQB80516.1 lysine 5,6-aminomutase subunit alpha [Bacillota bacterium]
MAELRLDWNKVDKARQAAAAVADNVTEQLELCSTVAVERAICRLFGVDGVDAFDVPLANRLVDHLRTQGVLEAGAAYWLAQGALSTGLAPIKMAEAVAAGSLDLTAHEKHDAFACRLWAKEQAEKAIFRIREGRKTRESLLEKYGERSAPWLYAIVATGNIYEDIIQAQAAARQGADVIAVIRTTGQSLLDYVPYGATTEGFGGTTATQENFRLMRRALDEKGNELGRYIRLCNYCSGLCMPEIAVMGALERLDVMLNDALYGILFRDINMQRTLIDQSFSRMINGAAGIIINTGEDNYLTTSDAYEEAHTVLASQLINEQFALRAGMRKVQMGLGHAFEMDPSLPDSFVFELAQAQMARQIFPDAPLKYMPPTKHMTGNIFQGHVQDTLFNVAGVLTGQQFLLLGMMTEAIHTPHMADRAHAIANADYVKRAMKSLSDEIEYKRGGLLEKRADEVLDLALGFLETIRQDGLFRSLEAGRFAGIKRRPEGGKGMEGVIAKGDHYCNPFIDLFLEEQQDDSQA